MQNAEVYFDANVFPTSCFTSPFLFLSTVFLNYFVKLFWKSLDIYKIWLYPEKANLATLEGALCSLWEGIQTQNFNILQHKFYFSWTE